MVQICKRTSIKLLSKFIEIALWHGCSPVNLQHIFRTPFPKNTSEGLLYKINFLVRCSHVLLFCNMCLLMQFHTEIFAFKSLYVLIKQKHLTCILCGRKSIQKQGAPATLLKKRLWHRCFPVNFAKFLRTPFSQNTSGRLLFSILYLIQLEYIAASKHLFHEKLHKVLHSTFLHTKMFCKKKFAKFKKYIFTNVCRNFSN